MNLKKYLNESKPRLKKVSEDEYDVIVGGEKIGQVFPTWKNPGGSGWTYTGATKRWFSTRKKAVNALVNSI